MNFLVIGFSAEVRAALGGEGPCERSAQQVLMTAVHSHAPRARGATPGRVLPNRSGGTVHGPVRTCQQNAGANFSTIALTLTAAGLTLTYWFVHCDQAALWPTYNDFDVRCRGRKDTSKLGGDVMTIRKPGVSQAAWVFASIASTTALGQTAPEPTAEAVEVDEIIVTGSRIARSDFSSTSPIVTYGEEAIAQSGTVNIEQAMNQLPQFVQGQTSSTVGAVALAGRASLNLRGLGETRNLVLLDGRRLPLSNANAVVDVNLIPQFILSGVETITGGASAVYGSDAMSGVVNFKSQTDFKV